MNKLVRQFDPFAEIDALQKQFFDDDWLMPMRTVHMPTTDVYTNEDKEMVVESQLPNFNDEDIHVSIDDNYLVVQAKKHEEERDKKKQYIVRESSSSLYRRIYMPEKADADKVQATFEDGVLRVTVPFKTVAAPKTVKIESKNSKNSLAR
jgi:HSP20 family protein